jgi:hypothetical protein
MKNGVAALCALLASPCAFAQSEDALKVFFEGKTVVVKLDMPAAQTGVDIYADARRPMNFEEYSDRLKAVGVAIRSGDAVMVTKIKVKDKLIEFQLAGGGFGTAGDDTSASVYVPSTSKSNREKDLEREVKDETDAARKRRLQRELDDVRREREREDQRNKAAAAVASEQKRQRIAEQRLHGGSRFNIRYQNGVPPGVTPGGIMAALADYVDFPFAGPASVPSGRFEAELAPSSAPVRKGMSWDDVRRSFGDPEKTTERMEGRLKVTSATFTKGDQRLEADFVEGVLIKYSISSR